MEKLLPQNIDAEQGVLGSIILDPEAILQVAHFLQPRDFYRDAHRKIYEAIVHLNNAHEPADFITLCEELERRGEMDDVGGSGYITSLVNCVPTSGNIEHYAEIVSKKSQLREAIHTAGQTVAEAYAPDANADDVLSSAQQRYSDIALRHQRRDGFTSSENLMVDRMQRYAYLNTHRGAILGVPTGYPSWDRMTGGLQKSDLVVLAARPAMGKTTLALCIGANAAIMHGQKVAVFSLEMSKEQLGDRLVASQARVDQTKLRTGWIQDGEWDRVRVASDEISESSIWIDDTPGITTMEMRSKARRLQAEQGLDLVIVDYLQLMAASASRKHENRVQEVSEISRSLKGLARELNVPVLALSQLSRAVENRQNKIPVLSDLRESGTIEQDSDIVLFIYRDIVYNPNADRNAASLIVAKHRNGPVGEIALYFNPAEVRFAEIEETLSEEPQVA